jgi:hypothetical protein
MSGLPGNEMEDNMARNQNILVALSTIGALACGGNATDKYGFTQLEPDAELTPATIDFGDVIVPYTSTQTFTLLNAGRSALKVEDIYISNDEGNVFSVDFEPTEVEEDGRIEVEVDFAPEIYEEFSASVVILTDDPEDPTMGVPLTGSGVDGPIPELVIDPGALDFGLVEVGTSGSLPMELVNQGGGTITIDSALLDGSGAFSFVSPSLASLAGTTIEGGQSLPVLVSYAPTGTSGDNATLQLVTDDPRNPEQQAFMLGNGGGDFQYPDAEIECPGTVQPPSAVPLDGRASVDPMNPSGELEYIWTILDTPDGSSTTEVIDPGKAYTSLFVDLAGSWTVQLEVENEVGLRSEPDVCQFDAIPPKNVHVELIWDTGNSDLDLHLVQGGAQPFELPGDCTYCNKNPDWNEAGGADDPLLALDDRTGYGPENINMDSPGNGDYVVWVHYFDDKGGGDSIATVRIWINGSMEWEGSALLGQRDMWRVGFLRWPDSIFTDFGEDPEPWSGSTNCE